MFDIVSVCRRNYFRYLCLRSKLSTIYFAKHVFGGCNTHGTAFQNLKSCHKSWWRQPSLKQMKKKWKKFANFLRKQDSKDFLKSYACTKKTLKNTMKKYLKSYRSLFRIDDYLISFFKLLKLSKKKFFSECLGCSEHILG